MKRSPLVALLLAVAMLLAMACRTSSAQSKRTTGPSPTVAATPTMTMTPPTTGPNSSLGINLNYVKGSLDQAKADLAALRSAGFTRVRLYIYDWDAPPSGIDLWRKVAVEALNQGFYVLYGLSQGPPNTSDTEKGYTDAVKAEAVWAQSIGNPALELVIGNEAELHPENRSKAPRDLIRRIAAAVRPLYKVGKISYSTSAYDWAIAGWISDKEGLGQLDRLGLNVSYSDSVQFEKAVSPLAAKFGERFYVSEFDIDGGFTADDATSTQEIGSCLEILQRLGVTEKYFYTYRDENEKEGKYGLLRPGDGTLHQPVWDRLRTA